jgi:hypothetical protein
MLVLKTPARVLGDYQWWCWQTCHLLPSPFLWLALLLPPFLQPTALSKWWGIGDTLPS